MVAAVKAIALALAGLGAATGVNAATGNPLVSPLAQPHPAISASHAPCAQIPPPVSTLDSVHYYTDAHNSVVDPQKRADDAALQQPVIDFTRYVVDHSDRYMRTGNAGEAVCVARWLDDWAQGNAFAKTANDGGSFRRSWYLSSLAISWLKIRDAAGVDAAARARIDGWLAAQARLITTFYAEPSEVNNALNNHGNWAAVAVAAAAVASNDRDLFAWADRRFRTNLAEITPEGALPLEVARGQRALHYHLFALTPFVLMARFERANGMGDFDQAALSRLETFARSSLEDSRHMAELAGAPQEPLTARGDPTELVWAALSRYPPSPRLKILLQSRKPLIDPRSGGDVVMDWGYSN